MKSSKLTYIYFFFNHCMGPNPLIPLYIEPFISVLFFYLFLLLFLVPSVFCFFLVKKSINLCFNIQLMVGRVSRTGIPDRFCLSHIIPSISLQQITNAQFLLKAMSCNFSHRIFVTVVLYFILG